MSTSTSDRSPPRSPVLSRVCDRLSHAGVYLLPVFYVGFVAMLFLIWRAPRGAFWLPAAAGALAAAMSFWSLVFYAASRVWPDPSRPQPPQTHGSATRPVPLRFVKMSTRTCRQTCTSADGARAQFTVSCFHAHCAGATATKNLHRTHAPSPQSPSAIRS